MCSRAGMSGSGRDAVRTVRRRTRRGTPARRPDQLRRRRPCGRVEAVEVDGVRMLPVNEAPPATGHPPWRAGSARAPARCRSTPGTSRPGATSISISSALARTLEPSCHPRSLHVWPRSKSRTSTARVEAVDPRVHPADGPPTLPCGPRCVCSCVAPAASCRPWCGTSACTRGIRRGGSGRAAKEPAAETSFESSSDISWG